MIWNHLSFLIKIIRDNLGGYRKGRAFQGRTLTKEKREIIE